MWGVTQIKSSCSKSINFLTFYAKIMINEVKMFNLLPITFLILSYNLKVIQKYIRILVTWQKWASAVETHQNI